MKSCLLLIFSLNLIVILFSCQNEQPLESDNFIGNWQQIHEYWGINYFDKDSLFSRDTNYIEFIDNGTCIRNFRAYQDTLDWFFRDVPRQLLLTQVGEPWPTEYLFDIVELKQNSQIWEYGGVSPWYTELHKFYLTRK